MAARYGYSSRSLSGAMSHLVAAALVAMAFAPIPAAAEAQRWYDYWPTVVTVKGFLAVKYFFGPPGYGETPKIDDKIEAWLLFLSTPINIRGAPDPDGDDEETDVRQIQLVVLPRHDSRKLWKDLRRSLGREVFVTGSLYQGNTAHYWTNVALELEKVALTPRGNDGK